MTEREPGKHLEPAEQPVQQPVEPVEAVAVTRAARQRVVCPECGTGAEVTLNRREADDFCPRCDFPLFWVRGEVVLDRSGTEESLRRLPGTAGRVSVGSATCPTCAEANQVDAVTCLRCGGPMTLPAPVAPAPAPPPPPPPAPEPEPEPEPSGQWWWVVAGVTLALLAVLVVALILG